MSQGVLQSEGGGMSKEATDRIDDTIFMMLNTAAERGDRCPNNWDLAFSAGKASPDSGRRILMRLQERGLIEVYSGQSSRVVKICGTGKQTAGEVTTHWRERPENAHRKLYRDYGRKKPIPAPEPTASFQALKPVYRDPCPRCGANPEKFDCGHSRAPLKAGMR